MTVLAACAALLIAASAPTPSPRPSSDPLATTDHSAVDRPCSGDTKKDYQSQLCAQWRATIAAEEAASEARRATNWAIIATLLSALGVGGVALALWLTTQSNRIARNIGQAQTRAYLSIKSLSGHKCEGGLNFQTVVQNSGQSPALSTQIMLKIVDPDGETLTILPDHEHFIPAQSDTALVQCYFKYKEAASWSGIVVSVIVAYADVFSTLHKVSEKFAGIPENWSDDKSTDLVQGMHVASYLSTMGSEEADQPETNAESKDTSEPNG